MTRIAIAPLKLPNNSFIKYCSKGFVDGGFDVVDLNWRRILATKVSVVILHWPDAFFAASTAKTKLKAVGMLAVLQLLRLIYGARIIWVAHNARPHDGDSTSPELTRRFLSLLDGIVYLSSYSRNLIHDYYPQTAGIPSLMTVHGHYRDDQKRPPLQPPPLENQVRLINFGQIRPYKNIEQLVARISEMAGKGVALTVAGQQQDKALSARIESVARAVPFIRLDLRQDVLPEEDLEAAVDAHQAVVLPYRNILNSGAALFALSRNRPVLAPKIGSLPELQANVGADWVYLYDGELTTAVIDRFLAWMRGRPPLSSPDLSAYDWACIGRDLCGFVDELTRPNADRKRSVANRRAA